MEPRAKAEKIVKELGVDFRAFTIENFVEKVEAHLGRRIIRVPYRMPTGLFGAWMTDGDDDLEYIFYRQNAPSILQIHIQLHELAHLLLGHKTIKITKEMVLRSRSGEARLPFLELAQLRSAETTRSEQEAEVLASLIQEQVIRHAHIDRLTRGGSSDENVAAYLKDLGISE